MCMGINMLICYYYCYYYHLYSTFIICIKAQKCSTQDKFKTYKDLVASLVKYFSDIIGPVKQRQLCKIVIILLPISSNMCLGCSK